MASNSETGHSVNVANFKLVLDTVKSFGPNYNPTNPKLLVLALTAKYAIASAAQATINNAEQQAKDPIAQRETLFAPLGKLITKSLNYFKSCGPLATTFNNAKSIANKVRAVSKPKASTPPPATNGTTPPPANKNISTSQASYIMRADALDNYIKLLKAQTIYMPNEADISIAALEAIYTNIKAANDNIGTIILPVANARIARNEALYHPEDGLLKAAELIKVYVKGIYGATSPKTKLVTTIKFRDVQ
ncbi:MAG: hypothetical protein QM541_16115 [Flavobacterium sp.]|nr:hypothetical protein [Flavobacterium sp.]